MPILLHLHEYCGLNSSILTCICFHLLIFLFSFKFVCIPESETKINRDIVEDSYDRSLIFLSTRDDGELQTESFSLPPFEEVFKRDANSAYEHWDHKTIDKKLEESEDIDMELEGNVSDELHFPTSCEDELEVFDLRIIHRRNRFHFIISF